MKVQVYYWKDLHYNRELSFPDSSDAEDEILRYISREIFDRDFIRVAEVEIATDPTDFNAYEVAEEAFHLMNEEPELHFDYGAYAKMIHPHTSMSIGDIVIIGEVALIAVSIGFKQLKF